MNLELINKFITDSKNEDATSLHSIQKYKFKEYLTGMMIKLIKIDSAEARVQLEVLKDMDRFLDRLTYHNCIKIFQAKIILESDRQIVELQQKNNELLEINKNLMEGI